MDIQSKQGTVKRRDGHIVFDPEGVREDEVRVTLDLDDVSKEILGRDIPSDSVVIVKNFSTWQGSYEYLASEGLVSEAIQDTIYGPICRIEW